MVLAGGQFLQWDWRVIARSLRSTARWSPALARGLPAARDGTASRC